MIKSGNGKGPCTFVSEEGCSIYYEDRPATCRYYPLGFGPFKTKDANDVADFHFLIKEDHCEGTLGHGRYLTTIFVFRQRYRRY
ncbi:MAG: hypothetical protein HOE62_21075 [Alphaproteobacteria bacterium]|nr:hypothetical protein [Alphaproteobacteria bacterium]MBT4020457.1 hypothetical protein [Alphaproteobacteria bacterium]MBT4964966.1 hypothetical protein [Alphaproteobacteria bacterium]MBT5158938.1 hypothetical protein [Alphaproteobacteria bacterium]MBT5918593.1 hypothetical protein [Alphaproteobacteria bacterium]